MDVTTLYETINASLDDAVRRFQKSGIEIQMLRDLSAQYGESSLAVRVFLASQPNTPGRILERLFQAGEPEVLTALSTHPKLPHNYLQQLLRHDNLQVRLNLAGSKMMANTSLAQILAKDPSWQVRQTLAANPSITPSVQAILSDDTLSLVRAQLLARTRLDEEILGVLCEDEDMLVRLSAMMQPRTSPLLLQKYANCQSELLQLAICQRKLIPETVLAKLCQTDFPTVLAALLQRPGLPDQVLDKIARRPEEPLRLQLAGRSELPLSTQRLLSTDSSVAVRATLCRNTCLDDGLGVFMAAGRNPEILLSLAENSGDLPQVREFLWEEGSKDMKKLLLANQHLTPEERESVKASGDQELLYHLQYRAQQRKISGK